MANFIDYYRQGKEDRRTEDNEKRQKRFGELVGQMGTATDRAPLFQQAAALNPQGAMQAETFLSQRDAQKKAVTALQDKRDALFKFNRVRVLLTAPMEMRVQMYKQNAPDDFAMMSQRLGREPTADEITQYGQIYAADLASKADIEMPAPQQETFTGQPQAMNIGGKDVLARTGSRGTPQIVPGAQPYRAPTAARPTYTFVDKQLPDGSTQKFRLDKNNPADDGEPWGAPQAPKVAPVDRKFQQAAQAKLPSVDAALRRLDRIEAASGKLTFGGGPLDAKALALTPSYKELEQAGASLMPVLTALTRVPGIGSQSDLEQRLAQLQIPSGDMYGETRQKAIAELRTFIEDLRAAYMNAANGQITQQPTEQPAQGGIKFLGFE
jgi:hypothetical protein